MITAEQTKQCLALGSFSLKQWSVIDAYDQNSNHGSESPDHSSLADDDKIRQIGGSTETIFSVHWEQSTDSFRFVPKLNLSKKKRNIHSGPNLKVYEIYSVAEPLTLRMVLSQVNGLYDPIGLIAPYILELKVALGIL